MDQQKSLPHGHIRAFWPIVIICVIAVLVGGYILWTVNDQEISDDISSMSFNGHKTQVSHPAPAPKAEQTPASH